MNIWQKLCIVAGAVVVALMFLVFPATTAREVPYRGYIWNPHGSDKNTTVESCIDYPATIIRATGAAIGTGALIVVLGFIPKQRN